MPSGMVAQKGGNGGAVRDGGLRAEFLYGKRGGGLSPGDGLRQRFVAQQGGSKRAVEGVARGGGIDRLDAVSGVQRAVAIGARIDATAAEGDEYGRHALCVQGGRGAGGAHFVGDGDAGPNTGGMGAYCPLPWAPDGLVEEVMTQVIDPTLAEMRRRGTPFSGLLYAGLALTGRGVRVVEFNVRFGDPETQAVLALLETPLAGVLRAASRGELAAAAVA